MSGGGMNGGSQPSQYGQRGTFDMQTGGLNWSPMQTDPSMFSSRSGSMGSSQQPSPMQSAFAPSQGMGGPMPGAGDQTGMTQDLSGKGWGAPSPMGLGQGGMPAPDGFGGGPGYSLNGTGSWMNDPGQAGGNMGGGEMRRELDMPQPYAAQNIIGGTMAKQGGGGMGGPMPAGNALNNPYGSAQPTGAYGDYMNRRNAWIDQLRGYVAQPQSIGNGPPPTWGGQPGPGQPPVTSVPPGGPYPGSSGLLGSDKQAGKGAAGGGFRDYSQNQPTMQQFDQLFKEDPRLAFNLMIRNGPQAWGQNKAGIQQQYFGGDANAYNQFVNNAGKRPLSSQERWRLNDMIGLPSPDRMG